MTDTISISQLRQSFATYLNRVKHGHRVLIHDTKKKITIAQITKVGTFDKQAYAKMLNKAAGVFSAENHPEWLTETDITSWLTATRKKDERVF